ncbi:MAG: nuclear transport factor 2 family protein, partial [Desulfofustis sp.]
CQRSGTMNEFLDLYRILNRDNVDRIGEIYTADILFIDPAHEIRGLDNLLDYFKNLYANVDQIEFEFFDQISASDSGYVRWTMRFNHPRLKGGADIVVPGSTHLKFSPDGKARYHHDYFDLGSMLYQHIPILGYMIKTINRRLGT